jgi:hypothetical protein
MRDKTKMDCRTTSQVQDETINSINELQDLVDYPFAWVLDSNPDKIIINNDTIQLINKHIKQLKGEAK